MHPELYAVLQRERERQLEIELRRRLLREERGPAPARSWPRWTRLRARIQRPTFAAPTACCAPA